MLCLSAWQGLGRWLLAGGWPGLTCLASHSVSSRCPALSVGPRPLLPQPPGSLRRDLAGASASSFTTASSRSVSASAPSRDPGNSVCHRLLLVAGGLSPGGRTGAAHLRAGEVSAGGASSDQAGPARAGHWSRPDPRRLMRGVRPGRGLRPQQVFAPSRAPLGRRNLNFEASASPQAASSELGIGTQPPPPRACLPLDPASEGFLGGGRGCLCSFS